MAKSLLNNTTKKDPPKKLPLQLFQLNKSTQFSYQHHFITVIKKKKKHTEVYWLYEKTYMHR